MRRREPGHLITEVPEEEGRTLSAAARNSLDARWGLIRDLCNKHRGEAREIHGGWRFVPRPFPVEEKYFHAQYCHTAFEAKLRTSWKGKPAAGGKGGSSSSSGVKGGQRAPVSDGVENTFLARDHKAPEGHWLREATVTGLPELFAKFGHEATAKELYEWWGSARVLVHKRVHGASHPARREAAVKRFKETGHWGHGRR